jgi:heme/copper-type cytochrome/quinol oxidase subunit 2
VKNQKVILLSIAALIASIISLLPSPQPAYESDVLVSIEASQYAYDPNIIEVNQGQRVTLELSSADVVHGIYLDGYDLEVAADPGQKNSLSFIADQSGSFSLRCSVTCGPLHPFMIGQLSVEPNSEARRIVGGTLSALLVGIVLALRNEQ